LGDVRYESPEALALMNDLYRHELRLFQNLFLPSVKLVKKIRVGSRVRRVYDRPQTPLERVLASAEADPVKVARLVALRNRLDPFQLAQAIDQKLERLSALAQSRPAPKSTSPSHDLTPLQTQAIRTLSPSFGVPVTLGPRAARPQEKVTS